MHAKARQSTIAHRNKSFYKNHTAYNYNMTNTMIASRPTLHADVAWHTSRAHIKQHHSHNLSIKYQSNVINIGNTTSVCMSDSGIPPRKEIARLKDFLIATVKTRKLEDTNTFPIFQY